jgi:gamma-glutamylcyclotransferase (GGCT)/AIG2-like uncharacterized protein YtfP
MQTKKQKQVVLPFAEPQLVFVYGSLLDRLSNNGWLYMDDQTQHYVPEGGEKETFTIEGFDMYPINEHFPFNYPFCVEGEGTVQAELYKVSPLTMYYLDHLEGYEPANPAKSMYDRKVVKSVEGVEAIMYFMRPDQTTKRDTRPALKIQHGNWRQFMVERISAYVEGIK